MKKYNKYLKTFAYIIISLVVLMLALFIYSGKNEIIYTDYSTFSTNTQGSKALFLLTQRMGFDTLQFKKSLRFLKSDGVMVSIKPKTEVFNSEIEKKYLKAWIEKGNTFILVLDVNEVSVLDLKYFIGNKKLTVQKDKTSQIISIGEGTLYLISGSEYFTNIGLKDSEAGVRFVKVLDEIGARQIIFNEYFQGLSEAGISFFDIIGNTGKLILIQLLLALLVLIISISKRLGKPRVVFQNIKRLENEELFMLSNVYVKAETYDLVLNNYLEPFKSELMVYLGLVNLRTDEAIIEASKHDRFLTTEKLEELLNKCKLYILSENKDQKILMKLIVRIEKIRKGII